MKPPHHLLRLQPARIERGPESVRLVQRTDVQWGSPIFRAPALPTLHQLSSELPFTANFRPRPMGRA